MKFTTKLDSTQKKLSFVNYSIQNRIYSYIIGQLVSVMPTYSFLICRDRITNPLMVDIRSEVGKPLDEDICKIRDKYLDIKLNGSSYTPWTHDQVCINLMNDQDDPWHSAKLDIARNKIPGGDTTLVYEIGQKQKEDLAINGFTNRDSLLAREPNDIPLELCYRLGAAKCPRIRAVLKANRTGEITPTSISIVPTIKPFEFFVDFETFNNLNVDFDKQWPTLDGCEMIFMIGVGWCYNNEWKFEVFIAEEESHDAEREMLFKFLSFLNEKTKDNLLDPEVSVLYHWTSAEIWQLRNAANRHGLDEGHPLQKLPWFDLQKDVFLEEPIGVPGAWSYGLKNIATALKLVDWPGDLGDGLRATVAGWKAYQTISPLESDEMRIITEYNEVDCRALYEILSWIRKVKKA
ncbi:MAG: ribonuclease H-like domain-containing protein [Candidatus Heimdallarchaeota archaeon]|nr:ribonuclease H-like domain-containing protein [Candidatus Heimdallarchaeota archaeon]